MSNYAIVRLSTKDRRKFQIRHDFENSHGNKMNELNNSFWYGDCLSNCVAFQRNTTQRDRTHDNSDLIKSVRSRFNQYIELAKSDYKEHHPREMKSNTNLIYTGIIAFGNETANLSREKLEKIPAEKLDEAAMRAFIDICEELGVDYRTGYLVKHNDEKQIHYHFAFVAYNFENHKVIRNEITPSKLRKLQDITGGSFNDLGYKRGMSKESRLNKVAMEYARKPFNELDDGGKESVAIIANVRHKSNRQRIEAQQQDIQRNDDLINFQQKTINQLENDLRLIDEFNKFKADRAAKLEKENIEQTDLLSRLLANGLIEQTETLKNAQNNHDNERSGVDMPKAGKVAKKGIHVSFCGM